MHRSETPKLRMVFVFLDMVGRMFRLSPRKQRETVYPPSRLMASVAPSSRIFRASQSR